MLVIFDCDGVLVDSEVLVADVEAELLRAEGAEITTADVLDRYVGLSEREMHRRVEAEWGIHLGTEFSVRKATCLDAVFVAALGPVEGMHEVIADLVVPRCVASSSSVRRIRRSLELTGLLDHFEPNIYSASMVANGKPAPDLFVHAAEQMQVSASDAVVVEDSAVGVAAGVAAGMTVIGFTGASHCSSTASEDLRRAGAHSLATDAQSLQRLLSALV